MPQDEKTSIEKETPAPGDAPAKGDAPTSTTTEKGKEVETPAKPSKETETPAEQADKALADSDNIERGEDGSYILRVDANTIYTGKTMAELHANVKKGFQDKETFIRTLKTEKKVRVPDKATSQEEDAEKVTFPNYDDIYVAKVNDIVKRERIDPNMLRWSDNQWTEYAEERNLRDWKIAELREQVKAIRQEAEKTSHQEYQERTTYAINATIIEEETQNVRDMVVESGIDPDSFDYEALLEKIFKDPKSRNQMGVFRSGIISATAGKEIARIVRATSGAKAAREVEERIAKAGEDKKVIPSQQSTKSHFTQQPKKYASYDDAARAAVRELPHR